MFEYEKQAALERVTLSDNISDIKSQKSMYDVPCWTAGITERILSTDAKIQFKKTILKIIA